MTMKRRKLKKRALSVLLTVTLVTGAITIWEPGKAAIVQAADENLIENGNFEKIGSWKDQDNTEVSAQKKVDKSIVTEYMVNGDFEDTNSNPWSDSGAAPAITAGAGYNGTAGLVLTRAADASGNPYANTMIYNLDTTGEVTYTVNFRAKAEGVTWRLYVIENGNNNWRAIGDNSQTDWESYSYQFTTTTGKVQFGFQLMNNDVGKLYVDDFSVISETKRVQTSVTELMVNGDFETDTLQWKGYNNAESKIASQEGYDNTVGLVLERAEDVSTDHPYATYMINNLDTTGKVTYTVSFRAKAEGVTWRLYVIENGNDNWKAVGDYSQTEWGEYSYQFTTTTGKVQLGLQLVGGTGKLYADDFSVIAETPVLEQHDIFLIGDFEEGINRWQDSGAAPTIKEGAGYDGTKGLVLTRTADASGNPYAFVTLSDLDTTGTVTYTVSFRTKAAGVTWRMYVTQNDNANWRAVGDCSQTDWESYSYQFITTTGKVQIGFQLMNGDVGELYVDDFTVNYGTVSYEKTYTEGIGDCNGAETGSVLSIKNDTKVTQVIELSMGSYEYSFRVKCIDPGTNFSFGIQAGDTKEAVTATSEWNTVTGTLELSESASSFGFYRSGTGEVLIDDVVLTEVTAAKDINFSSPKFDGETLSFSNDLLTADKMEEMYPEFTEGTLSAKGSVWIDDKKYSVDYFLETDGTISIKNLGKDAFGEIQYIGKNCKKIEIKEGTRLRFGNADPLKGTNTTTIQKTAAGVWYDVNNMGTAAELDLFRVDCESGTAVFEGPQYTATATTAGKILVNGEVRSATITHSGTTVALNIADGFAAETRNTVVIPKDTIWNDSEGNPMYYLKQDHTFYVEKREGSWQAVAGRHGIPNMIIGKQMFNMWIWAVENRICLRRHL